LLAKTRSITAHELAADYVACAHDFFDSVVNLCERLDEVDDVRVLRHEDACAMLWAVILTGLEASSLSEEERRQISPFLLQAYLAYWRKHCSEALAPQQLYQRYLRRRDPHNQLRTATAIADTLFNELEIADPIRASYSKLFSALFAHRILSDVQYVNEIKAVYTIV
jgi:hypothetical protein